MSKLQELRLQKGYSQFDFAILTNISINSIQRFEQKPLSLENCHLDTLVKFGEILNIQFWELLESENLRRRIELQVLSAQPVQNAEL